MKPAFSVIFFTVASGAGFGLFSLFVFLDLLILAYGGPGLPTADFGMTGGLALALIALGLMSSTFHLAKPANAWRAVLRFKTSWLSREGVFALLFFPLALLYLWMGFSGDTGFSRVLFGLLAVLLAWATVYSTGMIYACLKTIPAWHTPLVPAIYFLLAHSSGALLLLAFLSVRLGVVVAFAAVALLAAALAKALYYVWMGQKGMGGTTRQTATGLSRSPIRLLDAGHSHGNFVTEEFGFSLARQHVRMLRSLVFLLGFVFPLWWVVRGDADLAAATAGLLGLLLERWLFFAEARHVVRHYFET